jgi:hypothetical protein
VIPSVWNELEEISQEALLSSAGTNKFWDLILRIGSGKIRGLSIKEIVSEENRFWGNNSDSWQSTLESWAVTQRLEQAIRNDGFYRVLEQSPSKITVQVAPPQWISLHDKFNNGKNHVNGVTKADLLEYHKVWMEIFAQQRNWKMTSREEGEYVFITAEMEKK